MTAREYFAHLFDKSFEANGWTICFSFGTDSAAQTAHDFFVCLIFARMPFCVFERIARAVRTADDFFERIARAVRTADDFFGRIA